MHLETTESPENYRQYIAKKIAIVVGSLVFLVILMIVAVSLGVVSINPHDMVMSLLGMDTTREIEVIIWNIRLPQALTAVAAGIGLSVAGTSMQSILRNPLGSPFTLGISSAAAFGAAFSVMVLESGTMISAGNNPVSITNPYITTLSAFIFCMIATTVIIAISVTGRSSPEVMVLAGVAMGSLFTAGTMFLQYFADDVQLAAMVFWTFGDTARADWSELLFIAIIVAAAVVFFTANRWNYNAIDAGDETARGLGIHVTGVRIAGMVMASLVTAVIVAFLGIIGFVGLVSPHIMRRLIGDDHRYLIPGSCLAGGILLLGADTAARLILSPQVLPVAVLTSFLGAPVFIYLIIRGYRR